MSGDREKARATDPVPLTEEELDALETWVPNGIIPITKRRLLRAALRELRQLRQEMDAAVAILDHCKMMDGSYQVSKVEGMQLCSALGVEFQRKRDERQKGGR